MTGSSTIIGAGFSMICTDISFNNASIHSFSDINVVLTAMIGTLDFVGTDPILLSSTNGSIIVQSSNIASPEHVVTASVEAMLILNAGDNVELVSTILNVSGVLSIGYFCANTVKWRVESCCSFANTW